MASGVQKVGRQIVIEKSPLGPYKEEESESFEIDFTSAYVEKEYGLGHDFNSIIGIEANKKEVFQAFYHKDTPDNKKGRAKWIAKPDALYPYTAKEKTDVIGDTVEVFIEPKFCGPKTMAVEAFMSKPTNRYPAKILIYGKSEQKVLSSAWSKEKGGAKFSGELKFGDDIWLNVQLEGCNGAYMSIDVYHEEKGTNPFVKAYATQCRNGELNIKIKDTYNWTSQRGIFANILFNEEYYAIIKVKGSSNSIGKSEMLTFENKISSKEVEQHETDRPLKLGQNEINIERYETCRFKKLSFVDDSKTIDLFEEGKLKLKGEEKKEFAASEIINFDLDKSAIRSDAKIVLDNLSKFLIDNPFVPVELGAHCDIRHTDKYNDALSNRRAASSVEYLIEKGVSKDRISAKGYGKRKLLIKGENLTSAQHQQNRRVTIKYKISGGDAKSIKFNTISPNKSSKAKKNLTLKVKGLDTTEHCFKKGSNLEHTTEVTIIDYNNKPTYHNGLSDVIKEIHSPKIPDSEVLPPIKFIFPHLVAPNKYKYHIHSCRYYIDKTKETINVYVYPDIKWDFHFYINLTNDLSVKWTKMSGVDVKRMQSRAGKIGAEARWKQTEVEFGAIMEAKWNKISEANYEKDWDATLKYEAKIKQFYQVIAKIKEVAKYITGETKGKIVKSKVGKKAGFSIGIKPPNFCIGAEWQLARGRKNKIPTKEIGTEIKLYFSAKPLVGIEIVIDLLDLAVGLAAGAVSGGAAAPAARRIVSEIRDWLAVDKNKNDGKEFTVDMYINLKVWGTLNIDEVSVTYHTAADDNKLDFESGVTIGLTLEAGLIIKASYAVIVGEFFANGDFRASGTGSITFGHKLAYQSVSGGEKTLTYRPKLLFDGIKATVVAKADIGLAIKKGYFKDKKFSTELADFEPEDPYLIAKPMDIIKKIERTTGLNATIPVI